MDISEIPSIINNLRWLLNRAPMFYDDPEGAKQWARDLKRVLPYNMHEQAKQYYLPLIQNKDAEMLEDRVKATEKYIERKIFELERLKTPKLQMQCRW